MSDEKKLTEQELIDAAGGLRAAKTNETLGEASATGKKRPNIRKPASGTATPMSDPPFAAGR